jgi:hypothetical protein
MAEWSNAHAWKACEVQASTGSNPVLSAMHQTVQDTASFEFGYTDIDKICNIRLVYITNFFFYEKYSPTFQIYTKARTIHTRYAEQHGF